MTEEKKKKQVHFILQGKGGVGKSVIATLFAQYMRNFGPLSCIDTDPINPTFSMFKSLNVEHLNLLSSPNKINERIFDDLIEKILTADTNFVIDNGAGGFLAVSNYIIENDIVDVLADFKVFVHVPITGAQAFEETATGLVSISRQFNVNAKIIIWINEYFGKLDKALNEYPFYKKIDQKKVVGEIIIPEVSTDTYGGDIKMMLSTYKTFGEIANDAALKTMVKRRMDIFKTKIFSQLDALSLCN